MCEQLYVQVHTYVKVSKCYSYNIISYELIVSATTSNWSKYFQNGSNK